MNGLNLGDPSKSNDSEDIDEDGEDRSRDIPSGYNTMKTSGLDGGISASGSESGSEFSDIAAAVDLSEYMKKDAIADLVAKSIQATESKQELENEKLRTQIIETRDELFAQMELVKQSN